MISQLSEEINQDLLDDSELFKVVILDKSGQKVAYETSVKIKNPYDFDITRFVPNDKILTLPGFFELAARVIEDSQKRSGVLAEKQVLLKEDFNSDEVQMHGDEVITWKIIKREPGSMDTKAQGRPQRRPNFAYDLLSPRYPNKVIVVDSMPIDHVIEFSCWSKVAALANTRALWLEKLFINYSWAFTAKGAERFFWTGRGADTVWTTGGHRLHQRPLRFFVRLREFHSVAHPAIKSFDFDVTISENV